MKTSRSQLHSSGAGFQARLQCGRLPAGFGSRGGSAQGREGRRGRDGGDRVTFNGEW